jgi:hypothetical protein
MAMGILLAGQGYWLLLPFVVFFAAFYFPVMKAEEQELLQGHGSSFLEYADKAPLFVPSFVASRWSPSDFQWSRVVRNREHRNLAGLLVAELFLIVRWLI